MRTSLIALASVGALGIALVACGGGSSSSGTSPASAPMPSPMASQPVATVNNSSNATAQVTIHLMVPTTTTNAVAAAAARAYVKKTYGRRFNDPHIRTMANTSPTAAVRASGVAIEKAAKVYEQQTGRSPEFVSPATQFVELVLTSGATVAYDTAVTCEVASSQCSATFTVPLGTYTASLFLYDYCGYLLAAGSTSNVTVAAAPATNNVTITLNGVVGYLQIVSAQTTFISDPSQAVSNFAVTVTPMDVDYHTITTPGVLIDANFEQITGVTLTAQPLDTDITPQGAQALTVASDLSLPTTYYSYAGTGSESSVGWTANSVITGSPLVPSVATGYCAPDDCGYYSPDSTGSVNYGITYPSLNFSAGTAPGAFTTLSSSGTNSSFALELPGQTSGTYTIGLNESLSNFSGLITLAASNCGSVLTGTSPGSAPVPYTSLANMISLTFTTSGASNTCVVTATDDALIPRSASLHINVDSSTVTIQNKTRTHE